MMQDTSGGIVAKKFIMVMVTCKCGSQQVGTGPTMQVAIRDACAGHRFARYDQKIGDNRKCHLLKGTMGVYDTKMNQIGESFTFRHPVGKDAKLYLHPKPKATIIEKQKNAA